jgi:hypothetical protein
MGYFMVEDVFLFTGATSFCKTQVVVGHLMQRLTKQMIPMWGELPTLKKITSGSCWKM